MNEPRVDERDTLFERMARRAGTPGYPDVFGRRRNPAGPSRVKQV